MKRLLLLLCLLLFLAGAVKAVPPPQLLFDRPPESTDTNADLTLTATPGGYAILTSTNLAAPWNDEAGVTVGVGGSTNFTLPLNGRPALFLCPAATDALSLLTLGSTFDPQVFCDSNASAQLVWTLGDGTTNTNYPVATNNFSGAAARFQRLTVTPAAAITRINLGFDGADGGDLTPLPHWPAQNVAAVWFPRPLTNLTSFAASYNPITNTLDFSGFTRLENIECFNCTPLRQVVVTNLPALKRACFEDCDLRELDLSGNPNLEDLRGAVNAYTNILVNRGTGPKIWHWCTRDNPQLSQRFADIMTNFLSLRELYIWNDNQSGLLTVGSTNLTDVQAFGNRLTAADFTGQSNLWQLSLYRNELTNLVLTGCTGLIRLDAHENRLPGAVLDTVLATLDASAPGLQQVDLSQNAQMPSSAGYAHFTNLLNRGVSVTLDWPDSSDGSNNVSGGSNAITFVTTSRHPHLEIQTGAGAATNVLWHWGDGTITPGALVASHDFGSTGTHTNYIEVLPPGSVTYFGAQQGNTGQGIQGVYGVTNFPNLNYLFLYQESLTDLNLTGCASLRQLHLANNPVSVAVCDQWFIDLDAAVAGPVTGADFFYPAASRSPASDAAWTSLAGKGFAMHPF